MVCRATPARRANSVAERPNALRSSCSRLRMGIQRVSFILYIVSYDLHTALALVPSPSAGLLRFAVVGSSFGGAFRDSAGPVGSGCIGSERHRGERGDGR